VCSSDLARRRAPKRTRVRATVPPPPPRDPLWRRAWTRVRFGARRRAALTGEALKRA